MSENKYTFVVVDDEREIVDLLVVELRYRGHRAIGVWDLTTALQVCELNRVDAVILDCFLKGYVPVDLSNVFKEKLNFPRTYLMTGENPLPEEIRKQNRDNTPVFYKPFDIVEVIETMCQDLDKERQSRAEMGSGSGLT